MKQDFALFIKNRLRNEAYLVNILMNESNIPAPDIKVAKDEQTFTTMKIIRILVTLFFKKPFGLSVSMTISSKSFTFGFLM